MIGLNHYDETPASATTQDLQDTADMQSVLVPAQGDNKCIDSGIAMSFDAIANDPLRVTLTFDLNGASVQYNLGQVNQMGAALAKARAGGFFPRTKASPTDPKATVQDYFHLVALNEVRANYPPEEWNQQPAVIDLLMNITRDIKVRDKLAAEKSEDERVKAHVANMMSGVGAEAKLYSIVQHAITYANKNGSSEQAATITGQNMAQLLNGIRGVISEMADKGAHNINGANFEAVLEDVFGMIDFALDGQVKQMNGQVKQMDGQIKNIDGNVKQMNGQILHLNAIGQHVNAIDGHVHSLGNNLNSMGTLLNSTNGNVVSLTTQIALLQTIVNMLPQLISQACEQQLHQSLESVLGPILRELGIHLDSLRKESKFKRVVKKVKNLFKKSS